MFGITRLYGFFFLHAFASTIAFKLKYALFHQFNAKISTFAAKKCFIWLLFMIKTYKRRPNVTYMRVVLHPLHRSSILYPLHHSVKRKFWLGMQEIVV